MKPTISGGKTLETFATETIRIKSQKQVPWALKISVSLFFYLKIKEHPFSFNTFSFCKSPFSLCFVCLLKLTIDCLRPSLLSIISSGRPTSDRSSVSTEFRPAFLWRYERFVIWETRNHVTGGVFVVLLCGLAMAIVVAILEFCWNSKRNAQQEKVQPMSSHNNNLSSISIIEDKQVKPTSWSFRFHILLAQSLSPACN